MPVQVARGGILRIKAQMRCGRTAAGADLQQQIKVLFGGPGQIGLRYPTSQVTTDYGPASLLVDNLAAAESVGPLVTAKVPEAAPLTTYKVEVTATQERKNGIGAPKVLKGTAEYTIVADAGGFEMQDLVVELS